MKPKKTKKTINNLKAGKFVKCNGSTLYVFKPMVNYMNYPTLNEGIFIIERHPEKTLTWVDLQTYSTIPKPKKKHIDNAIKHIKYSLKFKGVDNLTYIENLSILKNYLRPDIVSEE